MNSDPSQPNSVPPEIVRQGDLVDEKYLVEGLIGEGGMAIVVAARHMQLDRRVALKILKPAAVASSEVVVRFLREARSAARLSTEHVARVLDVGTLASGLPYLVMEYLRGADLGMVVRQRGSVPPGESVDLLLQACEAIAEAHAYGIVHRDLKPDNLFLTRRADGTPIVKVLDFGVAKARTSDGGAPQPGVTQPSVTFGSPAYMSPEQVRSARDVDVRTDIWSLGVILYELVSGRQPFAAETSAETCAMVLRDKVMPIADRVPGLPPGFAALVHRCLEKDPDKRFQNIAEFAEAAAPFGGPASSMYARRVRVVLDASTPTMPPPEPIELMSSAENPVIRPEMLRRASDDTQTAATTRLTPPPKRAGSPLRYFIPGALVLVLGTGLITYVLLAGQKRAADASAAAASSLSAEPAVASAEPAAEPNASAAPVDSSSAIASASASASSAASAPPKSTAPRYFGQPPPRKKNDLYGTRR